jgi:hypothetical protein
MVIKKVLGCLLSVFCSLAHASPQLPAWQGLAFEQRTLWATAQSVISVDPLSGDEGLWQLTASSSVVRNSEEVIVRFRADSGRVVQRTRLSRGRDQRVKAYEYGDRSIIRERREPAGSPEQPQSEWQLKSRRELPYPGDPDRPPVTSSYALTVLADRFRLSGAPSAEYLVHTDLNFYRVTLSRGETAVVEVDYRLKGEGRVSGEREAQIIKVRAVPEGPQEDEADFSLLGLSGDISLFYDAGSGLLLKLQGQAPRIGQTSIELTAATLHATR